MPYTRRSFLLKLVTAAASVPVAGSLLLSCKPERPRAIPGIIAGASAAAGHLLRGTLPAEPTDITYAKYVIAGSGVAGLSAARQLMKNGVDDFLLLELESRAGGNSNYGSNKVSAYPWGAHYLPIPNNDLRELLSFLEEENVITGYDDKGRPVYNDYYLCFDPEERLYIHGQWQEGLIPNIGLDDREHQEVKRFLAMMEHYRQLKGRDGKYGFAIPADNSSQEEELAALDKVTMQEFMKEKNFTSPYLLWYVDYCCRDDYGTDMRNTSAWAGIHYFACRKGQPANADSSAVLTWPEGNGWLVKQLKKKISDRIKTSSLVYNVEVEGEKVYVDYIDVNTRHTHRVVTEKCIMASPQFVNERIVKGAEERNKLTAHRFTYAPWMVANITIKRIPHGRGRPLSWDNVFYGSKSLGYVDALHQQVSVFEGTRVITFYQPLSERDPVTERREALSKKHSEWTDMIVKELERVHKGISREIENIDVWLWGHGMIRPVPGFITSPERKQAQKPLNNRIFFAHSDLAGISIFEEAFYQGLRAANEAMGK